jgi:hypothetical protein
MTRTEIETKVLRELRYLPLDKLEETLDFVLFLRARVNPSMVTTQRPLGLLKDRATCRIDNDFAITDEELLQS